MFLSVTSTTMQMLLLWGALIFHFTVVVLFGYCIFDYANSKIVYNSVEISWLWDGLFVE